MENEFNEIDRNNDWISVYQQIRLESQVYPYTCTAARRSENKNLNRYRDVNPYDDSRVRLQRTDHDYINASLVEVSAAKRAYILTQGPLPNTTGHFWLMIFEQKTKAVLMLNRVVEKNTVKCHQYWPLGQANGGDDEMVLTDVGLKVSFINEKEIDNYTVRSLRLKDMENGEEREILHYHYTSWPDFGVPESPSAFLNFLMAVRASGALSTEVGPAVVHCSAGIGRSGTFCLVDSCLVLIENNGDDSLVDVQKMLLEMRKCRMGLIQTADQLRFSYLAIIEGKKMILSIKNETKEVPFKQSKPLDEKAFTKANGFEDALALRDQEEKNNTEDKTIIEASELENNQDILSITKEMKNGEKMNHSDPPPLPPRAGKSPDQNSSSAIERNKYEDEDYELLEEEDEDETARPPKRSCLEKNHSVGLSSHLQGHSQGVGNENPHPQSSSELSLRESELRKRRRQERTEKTTQLVQGIRKKQKEAEANSRRRLLLKQLSFGVVLLMGTGYIVYRYYLKA